MISRKNLILLLILLLAALLRFLWIDKVPHSINRDQLYYVLSAKSLYLTGKDITQTTSLFDILQFRLPTYDLAQAELPFFLLMTTVGPLAFSMTTNVLPNAIMSMFIVLVMYLIVRKLINEQIAIISALLTAINPWLIAMSRTSYQMIPVTLFYLCAFYMLLVTKKWKLLFAIPFFLLAFYSYIATKVVFLPIVLVTTIYSYLIINKRKYLLQYSIILIFAVLLVLFYALQLKHNPTSRLSELVLPNSEVISKQVDFFRKTSLHSPLLPLFFNKFTIFFFVLLTNAFYIFSPDYLFLHGDYFTFLGTHGLFYAIDSIFLLIGVSWLFVKKRSVFVVLSILSVLAIVPQLLHMPEGEKNFTPHISLLIPFFIMFIAAGIWSTVSFVQKRNRLVLAGIIGIVYIFLFGNFITTYFFHLPVRNGFFNFPNRILAKYIALTKSNTKQIVVYSPNSLSLFQEYLFYSNSLNKNNAANIAASYKQEKYTIGNVSFLDCDEANKKLPTDILVLVHANCKNPYSTSHILIPQLSDSGGVYRIYNDKLCNTYQLKPYISGFTMADLSPETFNTQTFCTTFLSKL